LNRFLPVLDRQLEKTLYLAGAKLSLADIDLLAQIDPAEAAGVRLDRYPSLMKWRDGLKKENFYTRCHASYEEVLQAFLSKNGRAAS
jgi:glutathione S-transferase